MSELFRFSTAVRHQPAIDEWLANEPASLFAIARCWFNHLRQCGDDVRELMHDGCATACVQDAAFAYVGVYKTHVNVGFFTGAQLLDPQQLLEGSGKRMRHVKLKPGVAIDADALARLIEAAYHDVKTRR